MKNLSLIIAIAAITILSSCEKDIPGAGVYFGTAVDNSINVYTLFLDDENIGVLPYFDGLPSAQDRNELLFKEMESGTYKLKIVDKDNIITLEGDLEATYRMLQLYDKDSNPALDVYKSLDQSGVAILHYTP